MRIETREATCRLSCVCCGASIRTCEKYLQVVTREGKAIRGERYCLHCEVEAYENNAIDDATPERDAERERETFAAYQMAGCPSAYFDDKQAGY